MEQTGECHLAASRDEVWEALNDPDVLARCLDGCQSMEKSGDDRFDARVKARIGPVRATFDAELKLENINPPESYTINANVKGGPAGFARGKADVRLREEDDGTMLSYAIDASVGGKLAQVGNRLIDGAARKMAEDFFGALRRELDGEAASGAGGGGAGAGADTGADGPSAAQREPGQDATGTAPPPAGGRAYEGGGRWIIWLAAFVALLLALTFAL